MADQLAAGSQFIAAAEALWEAIRRRHADVPPVVVVTGSAHTQRTSRPGRQAELGHFGSGVTLWYAGDDHLPELFIAGELLRPAGPGSDDDQVPPARRLLQTMLHEAAHGVAYTRKIKDTSRGARYHNRRFAALATELGLVAPAAPSGIGFSWCVLSDATIAEYAGALGDLEAATLAYLPFAWLPGPVPKPRKAKDSGEQDDQQDGQDDALEEDPSDDVDEVPVFPATRSGATSATGLRATLWSIRTAATGVSEQLRPLVSPVRSWLPFSPPTWLSSDLSKTVPVTREGRRVSVSCECAPPRRLSVTPGQLDVGPLICGVCGSAFLPADVDRDAVAAALGEDDENQVEQDDVF